MHFINTIIEQKSILNSYKRKILLQLPQKNVRIAVNAMARKMTYTL
ncbi:hypothetical protein DOY81_000081, partial [Sarcophaga bullata]